MRNIKVKILIAVLTFAVGVSVALLFAYKAATPDGVNVQTGSAVKTDELSEEAEEYAVYSVLIKDLFVKGDVKLLVISDKTMFFQNLNGFTREARIERMKKDYPAVFKDTLTDFDTKYLQSFQINYDFNLPVKYTLVNKDELRNIVLANKAGLKKEKEAGRIYKFDEKYPDARGMINLSRVGFNRERNQALVQVDFTHAVLCGSGHFILLEKKDGVWKIKEDLIIWQS